MAPEGPFDVSMSSLCAVSNFNFSDISTVAAGALAGVPLGYIAGVAHFFQSIYMHWHGTFVCCLSGAALNTYRGQG